MHLMVVHKHTLLKHSDDKSFFPISYPSAGNFISNFFKILVELKFSKISNMYILWIWGIMYEILHKNLEFFSFDGVVWPLKQSGGWIFNSLQI